MTETLAQELGRRLASVRHDLGMTQIPFAEALGVSQGGYNAYEQGRRELPVRVLRTLLQKFDVDPRWMLTGIGTSYRRDLLPLYLRISEQVDAFIQENNCLVNDDKRSKMIRYLIDMAGPKSTLSTDLIKSYLQSAV